MLRAGAEAPEFTLPDQQGEPTSLTSLLGAGPLILFFYPADFTPICTREACMARDLYADLLGAGIGVAGISPDSVERHAEFCKQHELPYRLLADPGKRVIRLYEADGPFGFGLRRVTYLIDADRRIREALVADFRVSRHETLMRKILAGAKP